MSDIIHYLIHGLFPILKKKTIGNGLSICDLNGLNYAISYKLKGTLHIFLKLNPDFLSIIGYF